MATLELIDHPVSSYAQKVRMALRAKNLTFKSLPPTGLSTPKGDAKFAAANPRQEVPVLIDGDLKIFDSTTIVNYLEDKWPEQNPLLPKDPAGRAKARMIGDICDTQYEAINWGLGEINWMGRAEGGHAEEMKEKARKQIEKIYEWLSDRLGSSDFFVDNTFGWADIHAAPYVYRSAHFGYGPKEGSPLLAWLERVKEIPSIKETLVEFDANVGGMAKNAPAFKSGERVRQYRDHRLEWMIKSGGIDVVTAGIRDKNIRFSWPTGDE